MWLSVQWMVYLYHTKVVVTALIHFLNPKARHMSQSPPSYLPKSPLQNLVFLILVLHQPTYIQTAHLCRVYAAVSFNAYLERSTLNQKHM